MPCQFCGGRTCVVDSRGRADGSVRRRRACYECGQRFSTRENYERDQERELHVLTAAVEAFRAILHSVRRRHRGEVVDEF